MNEELFKKRHSSAHILAQAVQREIDEHVQLGVGPAIDTWFYYDMTFSQWISISAEHLTTITKQITKIIKENQTINVFTLDYNKAISLVEALGQSYKVELIKDFKSQGETNYTFYYNSIKQAAKDAILRGIRPEYIAFYDKINQELRKFADIAQDEYITFIDLCEGPHVYSTSDIDSWAVVLDKIAWAYWRWDANNAMMTRIYGLAFDTKDELKAYQTMMEEAKKRDHRIIWEQMKLFTVSQLVWAWLPMLQPNWMIIRKELEDYLWELHKHRGYQRVWTPHLAKVDLYKTSWHYDMYKENFQVKGKDEEFMVKPMNCPHHMQIFADNQFSYRDMPVRYFEPATVYRDEKSGQLSGLTRVRAITQDDWHLFCRADQITEEVGTIVSIIKEFYTTIWMINDYWVSLSVRWEDKSEYLWSDEIWERAESALETAAKQNNLPYRRMENEAAFYGPKLDFMFKDAIWRQWQLATIQCDFNLPNRFDLSFVNDKWEKERPVVIHRAISGSIERFMGVMIEHFAWAFPLWLAPNQVIVLPVAEKFADYAHKIKTQLFDAGLRSKVDDNGDSLAKMIRNAEKMKIPYILVVGEEEVTAWTVSVREYKTKQQYTVPSADFLNKVVTEYKTRSL